MCGQRQYERGRAEAVEKACAAVCADCETGYPVEMGKHRFVHRGGKPDHTWAVPCQAHAIRSAFDPKGGGNG
jgi:hypothetical protein